MLGYMEVLPSQFIDTVNSSAPAEKINGTSPSVVNKSTQKDLVPLGFNQKVCL